MQEIGFLVALALPTSIECFTEGLQIKLSNILIGRTSGNNIDVMLSASCCLNDEFAADQRRFVLEDEPTVLLHFHDSNLFDQVSI